MKWWKFPWNCNFLCSLWHDNTIEIWFEGENGLKMDEVFLEGFDYGVKREEWNSSFSKVVYNELFWKYKFEIFNIQM